MKYRSTLSLIAFISIVFSQLSNAFSELVPVFNKLSGPVHIEATSESYCMYDVQPKVLDIPSGRTSAIKINFKSSLRSGCAVHHSSQSFKASATDAAGVHYQFEFEWYKPVAKAAEINITKNRSHLMRAEYGMIRPPLQFEPEYYLYIEFKGFIE